MSKIENNIRNTEDKWLKPLFDCCKDNFSLTNLPSHDQWHHLRVWRNACKIAKHIHDRGIEMNGDDLEKLIVASFFHDQGMSKSMAKIHGQFSKELCIDFFNKSKLPINDLDVIVNAIETHDFKEYVSIEKHTLEILFAKNKRTQIILNLADDIDAYGVVGIYRYIEIYLLRNIAPQEIAENVLVNLQSRFNYFVEIIGTANHLYREQLQQFMIIRNYFKDLQFQLRLVNYDKDLYLGPIGVLNHIQNDIVEKKISPKQVCEMVLNGNCDFYGRHFFERLKISIDTTY